MDTIRNHENEFGVPAVDIEEAAFLSQTHQTNTIDDDDDYRTPLEKTPFPRTPRFTATVTFDDKDDGNGEHAMRTRENVDRLDHHRSNDGSGNGGGGAEEDDAAAATFSAVDGGLTPSEKFIIVLQRELSLVKLEINKLHYSE
jgi:hypothetical protein